MSWRAALLGMVMLAAPGLPAATLLRSPPEPREWPASPHEGPSPAATPPPRWDGPARSSLASLRHIVLIEARRSGVGLAACEARMRGLGPEHRNLQFRRCATEPLARTDGFARANARMLLELANTAGPTSACRGRVMTLSGAASSLGFSARQALLTLDAPWAQVLEGSRSIREQARETLQLARAPGWSSTCKPRPPATLKLPVA